MDLRKIISRIPPNISARVISGMLALFITVAAFKCFQLIVNGRDETDTDIPSDNVSDTSTESHSDSGQVDDDGESKVVIRTDRVLNVTYGVSAEGAVLYNIGRNEIVSEKNMKSEVGCGDITAFAVALMVADKLECGEITLNDAVVCPSGAARRPGYSASSEIYSVGMKLDVSTLLRCLIYQRGSSFAYSLAVHISGSEEEFVSEMNKSVKGFGALNTCFTNVCGQDDGVCRTTAYDFAIILKHFFETDLLKEIFESRDVIRIKKNGTSSSVYLTVSNDFFEINCTENQADADGIEGGKTGVSGYLQWGVVLFSDGVYEYAAVVLDSSAAFTDAMQIYAMLPEQ